MWPIILYTGFELDVFSQFSYWGLALLVVALFAIPTTIAYERYYQGQVAKASILLEEMQELKNA